MSTTTILEIKAQLRSPDFTLQCLAVSKIPEFLHFHNNPDEVKTIFRLLTERFVAEEISNLNNYFRSIIVKIVLEISPKYIHHITNQEDQDYIIYNINFIMGSGDPTARTLALKMLGAIVKIAVEKNDVKHTIRRGIISKDADERAAAIETTKIFVLNSKKFAEEVLPELEILIFGGVRLEHQAVELAKTEKSETEKLEKSGAENSATETQISACKPKLQKFDIFNDHFTDKSEKTSTKKDMIYKIYHEVLPEMKNNLKIAEQAVNLCLRGINDKSNPDFNIVALDSAVKLVKNIKPLAGGLIGFLMAKMKNFMDWKVTQKSLKASQAGKLKVKNSETESEIDVEKNDPNSHLEELFTAIQHNLLDLAKNLPKTWPLKHAKKFIDLALYHASIFENNHSRRNG